MRTSNNDTPLEPIAYSIADACRVSSLGRTNLHYLIKEGKLEARKLNGRVLIPAAALRRLIEEAPAA